LECLLQELVPECLAARHDGFLHQQQQQHAEFLATGMRASDKAMVC